MDIIWLNDVVATNPQIVGSKAAGLAHLIQLNLMTPRGFVVTVSAFKSFLESAELGPDIASLAACNDLEQIEQHLTEIRTKIQTAIFPSDIEMAITKNYELLSKNVAVRSSGIAEDSEQSAFAGAYTSFLNQTTKEEVLAAVRDCWISAFSPRVAAYRMQHQLITADWLMGVIVQDMVISEKAGVLFTRNPYADDNTVLVEAVSGGCEQIVSGAPANLSLLVDRDSRRLKWVKQASSVSQRFGSGAMGLLGSTTEQAPRLLRRKEIDLLINTGLDIERAFQQPQDIEWAISNGQLVLLQARPLTAYKSHGMNK